MIAKICVATILVFVSGVNCYYRRSNEVNQYATQRFLLPKESQFDLEATQKWHVLAEKLYSIVQRLEGLAAGSFNAIKNYLVAINESQLILTAADLINVGTLRQLVQVKIGILKLLPAVIGFFAKDIMGMVWYYLSNRKLLRFIVPGIPIFLARTVKGILMG